jgi:hypothetical protein
MFSQFGVGTITEIGTNDDGIVALVTCQPVGEGPWPARVSFPSCGPNYGMNLPYEVDDTVLYCCPNGDPGDGLYIIGRFYEKAEPPPKVIVDNPDDEQWVAKKGRRLAIWTGGAELKLTNQVDDAQQSLFQIAADGTVSIVPPLGKNVLLGEGDGGAGLDFLVKRPLYLALVAFANTASTATTAAQIAVAAATLLTALQIPTPANPSSLTTVTKGA